MGDAVSVMSLMVLPCDALELHFGGKVGYMFFQSDEGWEEQGLLGDDSSYFDGRNYSLELDLFPVSFVGLRFTLEYFRQERIFEDYYNDYSDYDEYRTDQHVSLRIVPFTVSAKVRVPSPIISPYFFAGYGFYYWGIFEDEDKDDDSWFLIEIPNNGETCWIYSGIVDLDKTASLVPVLTPPPRPTPAPAPTQSEEEIVLGPKYFLIIPDNGGPFACGDGMVYFYSGKKSKDIEDDITVALNALFSVKTEYVGDYYNPLYKSSLNVKDVDVENGHATIVLGGKFVKPKSVCEAKRIHLQVWETASQFSDITRRPIIFVNNALLGDLLEDVKK